MVGSGGEGWGGGGGGGGGLGRVLVRILSMKANSALTVIFFIDI